VVTGLSRSLSGVLYAVTVTVVVAAGVFVVWVAVGAFACEPCAA
jgi:hypothetical protein